MPRICLIFAYYIHIKFLIRKDWFCPSNKGSEDDVFLVRVLRATLATMGIEISVYEATIVLFASQYCQYWIYNYLYIAYYMLFTQYVVQILTSPFEFNFYRIKKFGLIFGVPLIFVFAVFVPSWNLVAALKDEQNTSITR